MNLLFITSDVLTFFVLGEIKTIARRINDMKFEVNNELKPLNISFTQKLIKHPALSLNRNCTVHVIHVRIRFDLIVTSLEPMKTVFLNVFLFIILPLCETKIRLKI